MKKILAVLLTLLLLSAVFGSTTDMRISSIRPQHNNGLFVEFSSVGYSFANEEITSQPLLDILGDIQLRF